MLQEEASNLKPHWPMLQTTARFPHAAWCRRQSTGRTPQSLRFHLDGTSGWQPARAVTKGSDAETVTDFSFF